MATKSQLKHDFLNNHRAITKNPTDPHFFITLTFPRPKIRVSRGKEAKKMKDSDKGRRFMPKRFKTILSNVLSKKHLWETHGTGGSSSSEVDNEWNKVETSKRSLENRLRVDGIGFKWSVDQPFAIEPSFSESVQLGMVDIKHVKMPIPRNGLNTLKGKTGKSHRGISDRVHADSGDGKHGRTKLNGDCKPNDEDDHKGWQGVELCKKRILMGRKCRALTLSGVLHYDKDGILIPEY